MGARAKAKKPNRAEMRAYTQDGREVVSRSHVRFIRASARKVAYVASALRDKPVVEALDLLRFIHRPSAVPHVEKALKSAIANAQNNTPNPYELFIGEIRVETAPMFKRIRPASFGRAVRVRKRQAHLHILLTNTAK